MAIHCDKCGKYLGGIGENIPDECRCFYMELIDSLEKELEKEKQNVDVCESMLMAKDLETKCLNKELAGHKRGEEILSEANQQLEKELIRVLWENAEHILKISNELESVKAENEVLKMTIEHYKSGGEIKF